MDDGDVGVIQRGECSGFTLEPGEALRVLGKRLGQHLDGDLPSETRVGRAIDLSHSSGADGGLDFVGTEVCSGSECHRYLVGTRRFSSSSKCCTTMTCA